MLTNNRLDGGPLGALITVTIQSSKAATVAVVGFVSAGVLNLTQAVGSVIKGANIGTTIGGLDCIYEPAGMRRPYSSCILSAVDRDRSDFHVIW